ncbi:TVP38/TMEM64 family protein [Shouchella shacheensis]|uniref:TVP38/TMEM64 family protein n=1 Tax=Shouchella shacheensis TaxID=1649580 RepID=UPI000740255C|nr:VTT domain-containing protein [Shouchella shacheensis]
MNTSIGKIASFALALALLIWLLRSEWFAVLNSDNMTMVEFAETKGFPALMLASLMLMMVQNLATVVPLALIVVLNVLLFGFLYGYLWSWLTSMAASLLAFYLYRYWLFALVSSKVNKTWRRKMEKNGFLYVFFARLIPVMPTSLINLVAGASSISGRHYFLATALGNMIYLLVLSFVINGLFSAELEAFVLACFLIVAGGVVMGVRARTQKRSRKQPR